jgi:hypothetical protein
MATIATTARGTGNILSNRAEVNMSDVISQLQPESSPLLVLTKKLNTKTTTNYKFEWMEDDLLARDVEVEGAVLVGATSMDVVAGQGALIAVGDLIKNTRTGEVVKITAISTDTLTITRAYGETAAAAMNDADKCVVMANAIMQGDGAPAEKYSNPTVVYNYTQIFRTPFAVTRTLNKTKLIGGAELATLRKKKAIEHAKSIELAFLLGERKLDTAGSQPLTTTRGVLKFLATSPHNTSKAASSVVEADFETFCEKIFTYGSGQKLLLASPTLITKINGWAKGKLEIVQSDMDKTYGLNIIKYMTPHGDLMITKHPLLVGAYDGYGIVLDMEELSYRPLEDSDTKLKTNIQNNDEDGERDEYLTEAGLELRQVKKHGLFILT